jgi:hypothetical protein
MKDRARTDEIRERDQTCMANTIVEVEEGNS